MPKQNQKLSKKKISSKKNQNLKSRSEQNSKYQVFKTTYVVSNIYVMVSLLVILAVSFKVYDAFAMQNQIMPAKGEVLPSNDVYSGKEEVVLEKYDANKKVYEKKIRHADGSFTITVKVDEGDKVKVYVKTYSIDGNLTSEIENDEPAGSINTSVKNYSKPQSTPKIEPKSTKEKESEPEDSIELSDTIKSKDSQPENKLKKEELERLKELKAKELIENLRKKDIIEDEIMMPKELPNNDKSNNNNATENADRKVDFITKSENVKINANFPIKTDPETGKVFVQTPNKEIELKNAPDEIVAKAVANNTVVENVEIENTDTTVKYKITGKKSRKFLGLFRVEIPTTQTYDSESGKLEKTEDTGIFGALGFLTF